MGIRQGSWAFLRALSTVIRPTIATVDLTAIQNNLRAIAALLARETQNQRTRTRTPEPRNPGTPEPRSSPS